MSQIISIDKVYSRLRPVGFPRDYVSRFELLKEYFKVNINFYGKLVSVLSVILLIPIIGSAAFWESMDLAHEQIHAWSVGKFFYYLGETLLISNIIAFIWEVFCFCKYKPVPSVSDAELPICTVIVPAFNEGKLVYSTLQSIMASDYPADKLEIIAVDDGSADDTWSWIKKAADENPTRILPLKQPCNKGKRHALYAGFNQGTGSVFVTIDSDSLIEPHTLRSLVSPIAKDPKVGGVAGSVRVMNGDEGIFARMLDVRFMYSFEFMRACQSYVNTVICQPGALSAYRRDIVMKVLDHWLNQTFLGNPANIGEDRSMTNHILREGYHVLYQRDAVVWTKMPVNYKSVCKMFLRWNRSNVRECLVMAKFIFKNFRETSKLGGRIHFLLNAQTLTFSQIIFVFSVCCWLWKPHLFLVTLLAGVAMRSLAPGLLYWWRTRSSDAIWAYPYGLVWILSMSWIMPYALMTPQKTSWLTRGTGRKAEPKTELQMPLPAETPNTLAS
jgi:hyaluronan synthase